MDYEVDAATGELREALLASVPLDLDAQPCCAQLRSMLPDPELCSSTTSLITTTTTTAAPAPAPTTSGSAVQLPAVAAGGVIMGVLSLQL